MTSPPPKLDGKELLGRFRKYMRDRNLPLTHQRQAIASALFFSDEHLSAEGIESALRDDGVRVGKATIYRTLDLLVRAALIAEHDFGDGFKRYEARGVTSHHEHLICLECGKVVEFSSERVERMNALIADEHAFRHHHHRLAIYGVCHACQDSAAVTLEAGSGGRGARHP